MNGRHGLQPPLTNSHNGPAPHGPPPLQHQHPVLYPPPHNPHGLQWTPVDFTIYWTIITIITNLDWTGLQWTGDSTSQFGLARGPLESTGVHMDYVGEGKDLPTPTNGDDGTSRHPTNGEHGAAPPPTTAMRADLI
ncbi:hypothetical protein K443DRAFT_90332 [Laccaria amethystina LaAM-08-1]|uniref:Uncharacterized protein n=1 Tax=Laccaria amethystina LaAM-08-1 TaxID=1095629 RepID=A0A0C9XWJ6_9AGAR|nr:hypothetical protein K443DRAFT_90332 [Laccaria amethystina LaAM-08-1]